MKEYIYIVNGNEYRGTEAWGEAWKKALATAKEEHKEIERLILVNGKIKEHQFYRNGGVFQGMEYKTEDNVKVF